MSDSESSDDYDSIAVDKNEWNDLSPINQVILNID